MSTTFTPADPAVTAVQEYTLPQDGDAAVVSSVNQAFMRLANNVAFLFLMSAPVHNVKNYGAVGDDLTDDTAAIQAANLAAALSGGITLFPSGDYKVTSTLTPYGVWVGEAGISRPSIQLSHATADLFTFSTYPAGRYSIVGLDLRVSPGNTGRIFSTIAAGASLYVLDCLVNNYLVSPGAGTIFSVGANQTIVLEDCEVWVGGTAIQMASGSGTSKVSLKGCTVYVPAAFATYLLYYADGGGSVEGCTFDFSAHITGAAIAVAVSSAPATPVSITGNRFVGGSGDVKYGLAADSGVCVLFTANVFYQVTRIYSCGTLYAGSEVDLYPDVQQTGTTAITVPDYVRLSYISSSSSTAPTITLPRVLFRGQTLDLYLQNGGGSTWSGQVLWKKANGTPALVEGDAAVWTGLVVGETYSLSLRVVELFGDLYWMQLGARCLLS